MPIFATQHNFGSKLLATTKVALFGSIPLQALISERARPLSLFGIPTSTATPFRHALHPLVIYLLIWRWELGFYNLQGHFPFLLLDDSFFLPRAKFDQHMVFYKKILAARIGFPFRQIMSLLNSITISSKCLWPDTCRSFTRSCLDRIFEHMHGVLNVVEKITNYTV